MNVRLTETTPLSEAGTPLPMGRMKVCAISAGLGSSGYYSPSVIEQAAKDELIAEGTHLYLDHPSQSADLDRPERSVRDIAAVFTGPAVYDAATESLVGEIQVMTPYRDLLEDLAPHVGLSIRGSATDVTEGEHDGKQVRVIEGLAAIESVDFVTRAGRGGKVLELVESARVNKSAVRHGVAEATVNDTREALQTALRDEYSGEKTYVWVRDFDETTVWFEVEAESDAGVYGQTYTSSDGAVALSGDRTEVRVSTTYVPVRPGGTTPTEESKEDPMPEIKIDEAEHQRLVSEAGRVATLEGERDTATTERDQARTELAVERATSRARTLLGESEHVFAPLEARALLGDLPLVEADGASVLDETAFGERITDAAKESAAVLNAAGGLKGFGASATDSTEVTESGRPTTSPWGRPLEQKGA